MPTTSVERLTDGIGLTRCPEASRQASARIGSRSHGPRGSAPADIRTADRGASLTQAAVLQERARIARELHDSVSQTLYAIILSAARARSLLQRTEGDQAEQVINDVLQLAITGQAELRALLTNIRSEPLSAGGLTGALTDLAADVRGRNDLHIRLSLADEPDLPLATKEALVLIGREALHNVVKHGAARHVDIVLHARSETVVLQVTDDGRGFDPATPRPGHFGLQSMQERASAVGGTLVLNSARGAGTQVRVSVPHARVDADE